jgi:hypothetical protein
VVTFIKGKQHYKKMTYLHNVSSLEERKAVDKKRADLCKEQGTDTKTIDLVVRNYID